MLKQALEYIVGLGEAKKHEIGEFTYSDKPLHLVTEPTAETIVVHSLDGIIEFIMNGHGFQFPVIVHVQSPTKVRVIGEPTSNREWNEYIRAEALLPTIPFGRFLDIEEFNILLQSCFVPNDDRAAVLKVVGNIKEEDVRTTGDNGVSQVVTAKTGVATVEDVLVPNPVMLKPYRSFVEIEQPESGFVLRLKNGPAAALFEADGGEWKLTAMARIKEYLQDALNPLIEQEDVSIIG
jgi:hypothetical protein